MYKIKLTYKGKIRESWYEKLEKEKKEQDNGWEVKKMPFYGKSYWDYYKDRINKEMKDKNNWIDKQANIIFNNKK